MPKRDILLYNSASRGFTTNLGSDTVRIQGSSDDLLSIQDSSGVEQLKVGTLKTSLTFNSPLTASGNFSGSSVSSASFGRVVATSLHGDGSEMTDTPISSGTVSSSAQFASEISGAFDSGFEFVGTISGSSTTTGSFSNLNAADGFSLGMDISGVTNRIASGVVSGAAQIATEISGAFQSGFDFSNGISGSRASTGSFSLVHTDAIRQGDGRFLTNISYTPSTFSSSAQIASEISGAFTEGFQFEGTIAGNTDLSYSAHSTLPYATVDSALWGTVTDAISMAGGAANHPFSSVEHHRWDGASWSEAADLPNTRKTIKATGTQDAGLLFGGSTNTAQIGIEYNHPAFSYTPGASGDGAPACAIGAGGTQNAAFVGLDANYPSSNARKFQSYNGTNFSEEADSTNAWAGDSGMWRNGAMEGTENSAITWGGYQAPYTTKVEEYDGTSWSTAQDKPAGARGIDHGLGTTTAQITTFSGWNPATVVHEYNTGVWRTLTSPPTPSQTGGGASAAGTAGTAGVRAGGYSNDTLASAEQFDYISTVSASFGNLIVTTYNNHPSETNISEVTNIIPASTVSSSAQIAADVSGSFTSGFEYGGNILGNSGYPATGTWSAGGALNANTSEAAGFGTKAAAIAAGSTNTNAKTEEYNGSSWSEVGDLITGRGVMEGTGTSEAGVVFGGGSTTTCTEEWNGSNWSEVNDMIMGRHNHMKLGITSEAALAVGGNTTESGYEDSDVEDWNGTNWSAGTAMLSVAAYGSSAGTYDSGIVFKWPGSETFCWNGTNWSEVADRNIPRYEHAGGGSSNDAFIAGGQSPAVTPNVNACVEYYNGTTWSIGTSLTNARKDLSSADGANQMNSMVFGGGSPGTSTEEFTADGTFPVSASFGHIIVDDLTAGSITNLCEIANVIPSVMISSSAQIASDISGSFTSGFGYAGTVSGSSTSTGSFSLLNVSEDYNIGDVSEVTNAIAAMTAGTVSGSAQLASDISGSHTDGFEFSGTISGSSTSKLDIGRLDFTSLSVSDFANSELTGIIPTGTLTSGSAASIASQISGAFDSGFEFTGAISGSSTTSGSFNIVCANQFPIVDLTGMTGLDQSGHLSSSSQIAADISGSFLSGFEASEAITISGSSTSTGSFTILGVGSTKYVVSDVSGVTNFKPSTLIQSSADLATAISGSFQKGYIPKAGLISGSSTSTGSFNHFLGKNLETSDIENKGMTVIPVEDYGKVYSTQNWDATGSLSPSGSDGYGDTGLGSFSQYDNDYGVAGQLFVTNDGLLNITYETGSTVAVPPVWTEGPDTVSTRKDHASVFGTQNATLISGGRNPSADTSFTEDFNGISWTELNDLTVAAHRGAGAGTTNAGIQFGAYTSPQAKTEIWNGVTWHSTQNLGTGRATLAGAGTQNSALAMSGYSPGMQTKTELFNGISWSELNDNITGRRLVGGDGTSDAAFIAAGGTPVKVACTEEWNGSTWSTGGALGAARYGQGSWGSVNAAVQAGGGGVTKLTEEYNGTSWSETTNTISAIIENNAAGDAGLGITIQNETVVEMWTGGFIPSSSFGDPNNYLKTCKIKPNLISHYSGSLQEDN